jgi:hypothetical protein
VRGRGLFLPVALRGQVERGRAGIASEAPPVQCGLSQPSR